MTRSKERGFTLFELMVTLAVAAIVAAFAIPGFQAIQVNSSVSALAADLVQSINDAKSRAVTGRQNVYILRDLGSSATDVTANTTGDWSNGWRITRGLTLASSTPIARIERARSKDGNSGKSAVGAYVHKGTASATGSITSDPLPAFGFNNFGRMIDKTGTQVNTISIIVCAPNTNSERGRVITLTGMGRVTNNVVQNPATCS